MREPEPACDHLRKDHRAIEERLDTLVAALPHLSDNRIPGIQATVHDLQHLAALHFNKKEEELESTEFHAISSPWVS
jgi:hypothetical protein